MFPLESLSLIDSLLLSLTMRQVLSVRQCGASHALDLWGSLQEELIFCDLTRFLIVEVRVVQLLN